MRSHEAARDVREDRIEEMADRTNENALTKPRDTTNQSRAIGRSNHPLTSLTAGDPRVNATISSIASFMRGLQTYGAAVYWGSRGFEEPSGPGNVT
jgi:hypothetical protein